MWASGPSRNNCTVGVIFGKERAIVERKNTERQVEELEVKKPDHSQKPCDNPQPLHMVLK